MPPPTKIPTEQEAREQQEKQRKEAEEKQKAEEEAKKKQEEDERLRQEEAHARAMTEEADLAMLSTPLSSEVAGVSAASSEDPAVVAAKRREQAVRTQMQEVMDRVTFCDTPETLLREAKDALQKTSRVFVVVQAPTTAVSSFGHLLEIAKNASDLYLAGVGAGGEQSKIRIVILVDRRYDLLAKTEDRGTALWPQWVQMVVQLKKRDTQSLRVRPAYAVVITPSGDVTLEPTSLVLPKASATTSTMQCVNLRCTESHCPFRPTKMDAQAAQQVSQNDEFQAEDRVNLLDAMFDEADLEGADTAAASEADKDEVDASEQPNKHDCIVNLWPYAQTTTYYQEVLTALAAADKASTCVLISTTAHPAHWVACAQNLRLKTYILTRRWSSHSAQHGQHLGKQIMKASVEQAVGSAGVSAASPSQTLQCIQAAALPSELGIEAYDVSQGSGWHDGLNRSIPSDVLKSNATSLIRLEAEANQLRITGVQEAKGRSLETLKSRRDGDIVCGASALYWDSYDSLLAFLKLPGNACFCDRVVCVEGVKHMGQERSIWAVLVGVAQFAQHYEGYRPRANCVLEFDPTKGFNNGVPEVQAGVSAAALRLKIATRTGVGVSAGSPLLLNYGMSFDLAAASSQVPVGNVSFKGALDALFDSQRSQLPEEAAQNERKAEQERAAEEAQKALEERKKAQEEEESKRKLEEERSQAEQEAKRLKTEEDERKRLAEAVAGKPPGVSAGTQFVNELTAPNAVVALNEAGKVIISSKEEKNSKILKDTVLVSWTSDIKMETDEVTTKEWDLNMKSDVLLKSTMKRHRLDKLLKDYPKVGEVWKYTPFPAGTTPKVLVKKAPQHVHGFASKSVQKEIIHKFIAAARNCTTVSLLWILRLTNKKDALEPCGLALVTNKQLFLPGSGDLIVE